MVGPVLLPSRVLRVSGPALAAREFMVVQVPPTILYPISSALRKRSPQP